MAYKKDKLQLRSQAIAGHKDWVYADTGSAASFFGAGFFADGYDMGMRVDDTIRLNDLTGNTFRKAHITVAQDTGATQVTAVEDTT